MTTTTLYVSRARRRRRRVFALLALTLVAFTSVPAAHALVSLLPGSGGASYTGSAPAGLAWPSDGGAALAIGPGGIAASGDARPVPIASLAKVMTAVVVLRSHPISPVDPGFTVTITDDDVADTADRRADGQSVVGVTTGERMTERQALQALLLPSANNIAMVLARTVGGSTDGFVRLMNDEAARLGMRSTRYTDPSGYDAATVSTARDQVRLARAAMRISSFAAIVAEGQATIPVAGVIYNTDGLLGRDGFVGIKTGSDQAAGGCFMFAVRRVVAGHVRLVFGVVLGQRHGPLIADALRAARRLADSVGQS